MNVHTFRQVAAIVAASALLSAGEVSAGQDTLPPGTLTFGPVRITPGLNLKEMGVDNNVFNSATDPKQDFTFTLTPRADIVFRLRRLRLSSVLATDYVYYRTYHEERGTNTETSARLEVDLGNLKPYASVSGVNTKSRLNTEVDERARHQDVVYGAGVSLKVASRTSLVVNGSRGTVAFDDSEFRGVSLQDTFNGRKQSIDAGVAFALTPLTTLTMAVARDQQRFALSPDRDSTSWRFAPAFTFSPSGLVTGTASAGYRRFHTLSPTLPDYSGLVSAVNVGATIYGRNHVLVVFNRDVQYSYDQATAYYLSTGGSLAWTLSVVGPFDVRGSASRYVMDYRVAGDDLGSDTAVTYGGGVGFRLTNRARLGINGEWSRRDSDRSAERSYRNRRVFAGLTWGLT